MSEIKQCDKKKKERKKKKVRDRLKEEGETEREMSVNRKQILHSSTTDSNRADKQLCDGAGLLLNVFFHIIKLII